MELKAGDIVTGDDLHGRTEKLDELWDRIQSASLLLSSPRRFGKTSLIHEMQQFPRENYKVIYADMEGYSSPEDFIIDFVKHLERSAWGRVKGLFSSLKDETSELSIFQVTLKLKQELQNNWQQKGTKIFAEFKNDEKEVIIALDELPLFLLKIDDQNGNDGKAITYFLQWLRDLRQTLKLRFIYCGSIGIDTILTKYKLTGLMNDVETIEVPPFSNEVAKELIKKLFEKYNQKYSDEHIEKILFEIGTPVPFFIQVLVKAILSKTKYGKIELTDEIIRTSYQENMLGVTGQKDFRWYWDRLKIEFEPKDYEVAIKILDTLALQKNITNDEIKYIYKTTLEKDDNPAIIQILIKLQLGFYINNVNDSEYVFTTKVLKDQWVKFRGLKF
jgi:uncharacterized protein